MGKDKIFSNLILAKRIDIIKIEIDNPLKKDNASALSEQLSGLKKEAAGDKAMLARLAELERSLKQKFKKPSRALRSNQVGIAPTEASKVEPPLSKAQSRYDALFKKLPVKIQAKYAQQDLKPAKGNKPEVEISKLALDSLGSVEKILDKYSKQLDKLCNKKDSKMKSAKNTLPEDAEYITAKKLSSQLKVINYQLKEAKSLTDKVAVIEKIKDSFMNSIGDFTLLSKEEVHKCLPSLFSPLKLANLFVNYLDKDRHVIDDKLRFLSAFQYKR